MSIGAAIVIVGILAMMIYSSGFRWTMFAIVGLIVMLIGVGMYRNQQPDYADLPPIIEEPVPHR